MNEKLIDLRIEHRNTQTEIGELLDITAQEYEQKEKGRVSLTAVERNTLAEFYGIKKEEL
ncbi:hypothetical protein [Clostridium sp. DL1XJH146]